MPALPPGLNNLAIAVSAAVAVALYALVRGNGKSYLIDAPETVGAEDFTDDISEYDFVVIGGGTAGCVVASRLSEEPGVHVLLLEAGRSSRDLLASRIPIAFPHNMRTENDYNLWTEPQINAKGAQKLWPRGMFHHCSPTDYDQWAALGNDGWSYKDILPYFYKLEHYIPPTTDGSDFPKMDPAMRGRDGPVKVGFWGYFAKSSAKWLQACVNVGVPYTDDVNSPRGTLGVTRVMTYIDPTGKRVNTETAYLTPEVLARPNLKVVVNSQVTRILFDAKSGSNPRAVGVEFARNSQGARYQVRVWREVVLCAGAIHSPHILMLSGVGPGKHLTEHGISVVRDLPGVGQRLQDHAAVGAQVTVKPGYSILSSVGNLGFKSMFAYLTWKLFGRGPMTSNIGEVAAFMKTSDDIFPKDSYLIKDEASGPGGPNLETIFLPVDFSNHGKPLNRSARVVTLLSILLRPQSWGTLTLRSSDPFDAPIIDPRYLSTKNDMAVLVRGLRHILRVAETEPFASILERSQGEMLDLSLIGLSDEELEEQVRLRIQTLYHPVSTCRMASLEDDGVVDSSLRVHGIPNLRVADASIFPTIPSGHTSAPAIAVGEKAADMIKESMLNKGAS
ncbi:GMC oxidoreductase [Hysterangium stoloniferum]|nr:GMC oxidoreductase [Hysterangium stoloniferum]